ncbi:unnamed protein product [Protopolystoma xenopodis]|uniref:Uncharacterized protein n=1 Tax=Protopolystoma xenopodis TaxID=117903 RepID=A0A3S5ANV0_9PLAT|nr:unnamed protein product [Protopolystoma xenopodis]
MYCLSFPSSYCGYGCFGTYAFDCCGPSGCGAGGGGGGGYGFGGGCGVWGGNQGFCGYGPSTGSACGPRLWNCGRWP